MMYLVGAMVISFSIVIAVFLSIKSYKEKTMTLKGSIICLLLTSLIILDSVIYV